MQACTVAVSRLSSLEIPPEFELNFVKNTSHFSWLFASSSKNGTRNRTRNRTPDEWIKRTQKNRPVGEARSQGLKTLSFVFSHMKDSVEVINFHIKNRVVQGLLLCKQHKCLFKKRRRENKNDKCQFAALISMERFHV